MLKKILVWTLVVSLTAAAAIGGTLAYLTDRDSEANVFTVGDVNIDLNEEFEQGSQLIPGKDIEKDVQIKNDGPNAAWVWYTYAIPQALDGNLDLVYANEVRVSSVAEIQEVLAPEYPYSDVKIVLTEDLIIDKNTPWGYADSNGAHFQIWKNKSVTFDLNGHKIVVKEDAVKDGKTYATALFLVRNASLNLVGPGAIEVNNYAVAVYCWQDQYQKHSVNIYGDVKITSNSVDRAKENGSPSPESIIYIQHADDAENGLDKHLECNIYGGVLDGYALNVADKCTSKHEPRQMFVLYEGVKFSAERYDLLESDLEKERIKLADGCKLEYADGWYTVVGPKEQEQFGGADNGNWLNGQPVGTMEKDGITYNVYVRLYKEILKAEETTTLDLTAVKLAKYVDITPDGQLYKVVDGETVKIDWNITQNDGDTPVIYVSAYAIQTEGFSSVQDAYAAYQTQWGDNGAEYAPAVNPIDTAVELEDALNSGTPALLDADIVLDKPLSVSEEVYIDLNGHTLTAACLELQKGGTIANGIFYSDKDNSMLPHLKAIENDVTLENLTVYINHYMNYGGGLYYANSAEFSGVDVINGNLVLNNCDLNVTVPNNSAFHETWLYGISVNNGTVTMNGGSIVFSGNFGSKVHCNAVVSGTGTSVVNLYDVDIQNGNCFIVFSDLGDADLTINTNVSSMNDMIPVNLGGQYDLNYTP